MMMMKEHVAGGDARNLMIDSTVEAENWYAQYYTHLPSDKHYCHSNKSPLSVKLEDVVIIKCQKILSQIMMQND